MVRFISLSAVLCLSAIPAMAADSQLNLLNPLTMICKDYVQVYNKASLNPINQEAITAIAVTNYVMGYMVGAAYDEKPDTSAAGPNPLAGVADLSTPEKQHGFAFSIQHGVISQRCMTDLDQKLKAVMDTLIENHRRLK